MMQGSDKELLPCPFCGCKAHFEMDDDRWEWIECESCGMQGNRSASLMEDCKPKLAEAWNSRAQPAQVQEGWKLVPQWGKAGTCEWHDGYADHSDGGGPYKERVLYAPMHSLEVATAPPDAAPKPPDKERENPVDHVLMMLLAEKAENEALIAKGICPTCKGKGECGGQFTGGEWTCEECNGTGKAHGIGKQDK